MRILGGKSKGRPIKTPRGLHVRPTSGKVREALFSILSDRIPGARVLDLFSGTGAVGIEALSRGAASVDFVENHSSSLRMLQNNLIESGLKEKARVHRQNVLRYLNQRDTPPDFFDIVFLDPPYHTEILRKLLPLLSRGVNIKDSGIMIVEHFHKLSLPKQIGPYHQFRSLRYGDTILSFYQPA